MGKTEISIHSSAVHHQEHDHEIAAAIQKKKKQILEQQQQQQKQKQGEENTTPIEKNASERNFSDINFKTYLISTFTLCALRCVILHPLIIIVARKQICAETAQKRFLQIASEMRAKEGGIFKAFSQGIFAMTLGMSISETTFNGVYEFGRYALQQHQLDPNNINNNNTKDDDEENENENVVADLRSIHEAPSVLALGLSETAATAGAAWSADWSSRMLFSPFNVVAIRQMTFHCPGVSHHVLKFENNSAWHIASESYKIQGFRSFFSGFGLVLCVGSFTSSVFMATYVNAKKVAYRSFSPWLEEFEKQQISEKEGRGHDPSLSYSILTRFPTSCSSSKDNFLLNSGASLVGSSLASIIVNPYYVVLGKVQSGVAKSVRESFMMVMKQHGYRGFYSGAISGAITTLF